MKDPEAAIIRFPTNILLQRTILLNSTYDERLDGFHRGAGPQSGCEGPEGCEGLDG